MILVEFLHIPEGVAALVNYLRGRGYILYTSIGDDHVYINKNAFNGKLLALWPNTLYDVDLKIEF